MWEKQKEWGAIVFLPQNTMLVPKDMEALRKADDLIDKEVFVITKLSNQISKRIKDENLFALVAGEVVVLGLNSLAGGLRLGQTYIKVAKEDFWGAFVSAVDAIDILNLVPEKDEVLTLAKDK